MLKKKPGNGNLLGRKDSSRNIRVVDHLSLSRHRVERFVRIRNIDVQAEGFLRFRSKIDASLSRTVVRFRIFDVLFFTIQSREIGIPRVRLIGCRMGNFAANAHEVSCRFHQINEVGILSIFHLVKAFDTRIVRVTARKKHVPGGVTTPRLHVGIMETQPFSGETIDVRCRVLEFAIENAHRIATHIVHGHDQNVWRRLFALQGPPHDRDKKNEDGHRFHDAYLSKVENHRIPQRSVAPSYHNLPRRSFPGISRGQP